jgi:hypothetical protein
MTKVQQPINPEKQTLHLHSYSDDLNGHFLHSIKPLEIKGNKRKRLTYNSVPVVTDNVNDRVGET